MSKLHFTSFSLSLISTVNVFLVLFNAFSLLISRASYTFPLYTFEIMAIVLRLIYLNCWWHLLVCSVAPIDFQLPFMLSCWCSMQRINTLFFDLAIYLPLEEQSNCYTSGCLLGTRFGLFWHRMLHKFLLIWKCLCLPVIAILLWPKFCFNDFNFLSAIFKAQFCSFNSQHGQVIHLI